MAIKPDTPQPETPVTITPHTQDRTATTVPHTQDRTATTVPQSVPDNRSSYSPAPKQSSLPTRSCSRTLIPSDDSGSTSSQKNLQSNNSNSRAQSSNTSTAVRQPPTTNTDRRGPQSSPSQPTFQTPGTTQERGQEQTTPASHKVQPEVTPALQGYYPSDSRTYDVSHRDREGTTHSGTQKPDLLRHNVMGSHGL